MLQTTRAIVSRAARRRSLRHFVHLAGPALLVTSTAGLVGAIADRLIGPGIEWWNWLVWPLAGGTAAALALTALKPSSHVSAAIEVDRTLRLKDRLASALALSDRAEHDAFAALTIEESERLAAGIDVRRGIPIVFGRSWRAWPVCAAAAAAISAFVPLFQMLESSARATTTTPEQRAEARRAIEKALKTSPEVDAGPGGDGSRREALDKIAAELEAGER